MQRLKAAIADAGYEPVDLEREPDAQEQAHDRELGKLRRELGLGAALSAPLVLIAMLPMIVPGLEAAMQRVFPMPVWGVFELLLATPVQFHVGRRFYRQGWAELSHKSPGMNTLVMMGSSAAYFYSVLALFAPGLFPAGTAHLYFEASAVIITLILRQVPGSEGQGTDVGSDQEADAALGEDRARAARRPEHGAAHRRRGARRPRRRCGPANVCRWTAWCSKARASSTRA